MVPSSTRTAPHFSSNRVKSIIGVFAALGIESLLIYALHQYWSTVGLLDTARAVALGLLIAIGLFGMSGCWYASRALIHAQRADKQWRAGHHQAARIDAEESRTHLASLAGIGLAILIVVFLLLFTSANGGKIRQVFLNGDFLSRSRPALLRGFWLNIKIFVTAQVLVTIWALLVAIVRQLPGRGAAPVRLLAVIYSDVFRGVPAVIVIYAVVLGFPLAGVPPFADMQDKDLQRFWLAVLALVLVYGAYVSEVYRAGIESIHWSQTAGARSLGLSQWQTYRHVIVPQAVRRILPPLLNDFIALQKDTALVSFAGLVDIVGQSNLLKNRFFNLTPVFGAALLFLAVTIPFTRFLDYLIRRDQARTQAG